MKLLSPKSTILAGVALVALLALAILAVVHKDAESLLLGLIMICGIGIIVSVERKQLILADRTQMAAKRAESRLGEVQKRLERLRSSDARATVDVQLLSQLKAAVESLDKAGKRVAAIEDILKPESAPARFTSNQERQVSETAARFDWLSRRFVEQEEALAAVRRSVEEASQPGGLSTPGRLK